MIKDICICGTGGVGGYFGGLLAYHANQHPDFPRIHFLARGEHLSAIREKGLLLKKGDQELLCRPECASEKLEDLPVAGTYIIAVKSYDLEAVVERLDGILEDDSLILPLLNGVDVYERIRNITQKGKVLPACVYVGTHIESPGIVAQKGGQGRILLGHDPLYERHRPGELLQCFQDAGISIEWQKDPYPAIWSKFMFIAAYGLVTSAFSRSLGEVYADDTLRSRVEDVMREIYFIAQARKVNLSQNIIDKSLEKAAEFPYETRTSLQRDVEKAGKKHEGDLFGGTILRLSEECGLEAPMTRELMALIRDN